MIEIYRPKANRGETRCKNCGQSIHSVKDTIILEPRIGWIHWKFHNECFVDLRKQLNDTNIFTVKEK